MKTRLTSVAVAPGIADIIAHIPPHGDTAGYRARVARAVRDPETGRWTAYLYARAWPLHEPLPKGALTVSYVQSERNLNGKHTLASLLGYLRQRDEWWTA